MEEKNLLKEEELEKVTGGVTVLPPTDANYSYTIILEPGEPAQAALNACDGIGLDRKGLLVGAEDYLNDPCRINTRRTMKVKIDLTTEWNGAPMPLIYPLIVDVQYV